MSDHAYYMPSGAGIWGECPAAVTALNTMPRAENERTRQGQAAHWVAAECLTHGRSAAVYMGQKAPNGVIIDTEIIEGVTVYVDDIMDRAAFCPSSLWIERRVNMPGIHADMWGTLDAALIDHDTLYIWDYKHGFAEVSPERNKQLSSYARGALNAVPNFQPRRIVFTVVQPFAYHADGPVRRWECRSHTLSPLWAALHAAAHADTRTAIAGLHCRYCPARGFCSVRRETDYRYMDASACPVDFDNMDTRSLATEYRILKDHATLVKSRLEAISDELEHRIKKGDTSGGITMGSKAGRLEWAKPPLAIITALQAAGIDARQIGCLTPRQVALGLPAAQREQFYKTIKPITKRKYSLKLLNPSDTIAGRVFERR